ncbi:hypothetical protein Tco_0530074 [Tanacetum coccineum]
MEQGAVSIGSSTTNLIMAWKASSTDSVERKSFCWLNLRLESEEESTMALELIRFIKKNKELSIPEQTATGKGTSNPLMAGSLPKTTKPTIVGIAINGKNQELSLARKLGIKGTTWSDALVEEPRKVVRRLIRNYGGSGGLFMYVNRMVVFRLDVLRFHTCLTDILGFLEKLGWWFEQDIDVEEGRFEGDEDGGEV